MASQRRAPTKRPPRPAAKKPPPPPGATDEGIDAVETGKTKAATSPKSGPTPTSKSALKSADVGTDARPGTPRGATSTATKSTSSPAAKPKPSPSPSPSGPNYRPPTGAARSAARRPPPPRRKKPRVTKKTIGAIVALALVGSLVVFFSLAVNGSTNSPAVNTALSGPEGVPVPKGPTLASVDSSRYPQAIDGIKCEVNEQLVSHIHTHLTIFVNGQARQIPYGIGMTPPLQYNTSNGTYVNGGQCFYWLHTHAADGIIHVESPTQTTYTLGQLFDMWGQPLKAGQVGPALGALKVFVDGKPYTGDPRAITLTAHGQIQLDVGTPAPAPVSISFPTSM